MVTEVSRCEISRNFREIFIPYFRKILLRQPRNFAKLCKAKHHNFREIKKGKTSFRVDKYGIIHTTVGRMGFKSDQLVENAKEVEKELDQKIKNIIAEMQLN